MKTLHGEFELKASPIEISDAEKGLGIMKMLFEKVFDGELSGVSVVSMMGVMDKDTASGGYVAIEKFNGQVAGRNGSFMMQHSSTMNNGAQNQSIQIIPNSGIGDLVGISGSMTIEIKEGKHYYVFEYEV